MNSLIGNSTGLALLMAAALLAALFAMGVFAPSGAKAAPLEPKNVKYSTAAVNPTAAVDLEIQFTLAADGESGDTITLSLGNYNASAVTDADTSDDDIDVGSVTVDNADGGDVAVTSSVLSSDKKSIIVTLGAELDSTPANATDANQTSVTIASAAGITPTAMFNCYGQSDWSMHSSETAVASVIAANAKNISSCEPGSAIEVRVDGTATTAVGPNNSLTVDLTGFTVPGTFTKDQIEQIFIYNNTAPAGTALNPSRVNVAGKVVTLTVPNYAAAGATPTGLTTTYTVVFSQSSGITNPSAAGPLTIKITDNDADNDTLTTGNQPTEDHGVTIQRVVKLSKASGIRGTMTTATLKGFSDKTATVLLENTKTGNPFKLGEVKVEKNVGTLEIDTTSSNFIAGDKANTITANDGDANATPADVDATFTVSPNITLDPAESAVSKSVKIKLTDWPAGKITEVKLAGTTYIVGTGPGTVVALPTIDDTGQDEITLVVATNTNRGTQTVKVTGTDPDKTATTDGPKVAPSATASLKIGVLALTVEPAMAVPGQTITITGSGFANGDMIGQVTIGGFPVTVSPKSEATTDGNVVVTVKVPSPKATAGIGTGMKTVVVEANTDTAAGGTAGNSGRIAEGQVEIPKAMISLDPAQGRRDSPVTLTGSGFPAKTAVSVYYGDNLVTAKISDSSGAIDIDFNVPTDAAIGGDGQDVAAKSSEDTYKAVEAKTKHSTPPATVSLSAEQATIAGQITVNGSNFAAHTQMSELKIGDIDVRPVPAPLTNNHGDFSETVSIPGGVSVGSSIVKVSIGTTTKTVLLEIVDAPASMAPADVFASLMSSERLVRVWQFDNASKVWSFYDPRPEFASFNTLTEVSSGGIVTVIISEGDNIMDFGSTPSTLYPGTNQVVLD